MQLTFALLSCLAHGFMQTLLDRKNASNLANPIIIDTDVMTDVDDVGALAIANVFHNCGLCDFKAVMVNTHSEYGALTASAIKTYFGNGDIPIASIRPIANETFSDKQSWTLGEYASKIAHNYPRSLNATSQTPHPFDLYHSLLTSAQNKSITLISIGFLSNIAPLLLLLSSPSLLTSKIRKLVIMGGQYPSGWEYNFGGKDPNSTATVINNWPKTIPITYSGLELGASIFSGQNLRQHAPADSPVLSAYEWYNGRCSTTRESWDPITVLYGILGLEGFSKLGLKTPFKYANTHGYNSIVAANGSNAWVNDSSVTNQHWLELADDVSNSSVASVLTQLYAHDPISRSCF